jgi:hypothetical protein
MSQLQVTGEAKIRDIQGPVVANSGVITALDGAASQYVRGDGTLADFPTSSGGGSSVSYYLNSSVSQGTIGGVAYRELSKEPIIGAGTDIAISSNGYVASYLTDANDPDVVLIPGGNFNCELYFSVNNNTGNPFTYAELYKYDGTTFTLLGSSVGVPEYITQGTTIAPYYFAIPVATATLALTDRLAIRIYVNVDGRTVTLHTENGHLCQVVTTLSKGMVSLNNLTDQSQFLTTGTSGTNFNIASSGDTHTFNLPVASATNTGKLSSTDWSTFNNKVPYTGATANVDLGINGLIAGAISSSGIIVANGLLGALGGLDFQKGNTPSLFTLGDVILYSEATTNNVVFRDNASKAKLEFNNSTQTYTFPAITGTLALLEGSQTFSGTKTFSALTAFTFANGTRMDYGLYLSKGSVPSAFSSSTTNIYSDATTNNIVIRDNSSNAKLEFNNSTQTYTFPAASGTIALTSNLGSYLPLAGGIMTGSILLNNNISISGQLFGTSSYANMLSISPSDKILIDNGGRGVIFGGTIGQGAYTYTLPSATGTLALTSQLTSGTVTSVGLSSATSGVTIGSSPITTSGTITLAIATASGSQNGLLSSTDWTTFNNKLSTAAAAATYVPYTGATTNVNLGVYNLTANQVIVGGAGVNNAGTFTTYDGGVANLLIGSTGNLKFFPFWNPSIGARINAENSAGSAYIPLSLYASVINLGGALSGTSASFSSSVTATQFITGGTPSNTAGFTNSFYAESNIPSLTLSNTGTNTGKFTLGVTNGNFGLWNNATSTYPIFINSSNNVGIGTSSPQSLLQVGNFTNNSILTLAADASSVSSIYFGDGTGAALYRGFVEYTHETDAMRIGTSATERMRISSGGDVGIGAASITNIRLYVKGASADSNTQSFNVSNSAGTNLLFVRSDGVIYTGTAALSPYNLTTANSANLFVASDGGLLRSTSSLKYKKNVKNYTKGLAEVMQLRAVTYQGKNDRDNDKQFAGLIAEEVHELGLTEFVQYAEDGSPDALAYQNMIALAFKAIQELKAEIDELKNK